MAEAAYSTSVPKTDARFLLASMREHGSRFYAAISGGRRAVIEDLPNEVTDGWIEARQPFLAAHKANLRAMWPILVEEGCTR